MLRKLFITSLDVTAGKVIAAAGEALGYPLGDYAVIKPGDEGCGWQDREPRGYYLAIYDDLKQTPKEVLEAVRRQLRRTGHRAIARSLSLGVNWVYMPDGMPGEWYDQVWPECELLRNMEESIEALGGQATAEDAATMQALRDRLQPTLDAGIAQSEQVLVGWALDMGQALGGIEMNTEKFETSALLHGALTRIQEREQGGTA